MEDPDEILIVKVQTPSACFGGPSIDQVLIYDQSRRFLVFVPLDDVFRCIMGRQGRAFFAATFDGRGRMRLAKKLPEQGW
jgi:hypothetical protein